MGTLFSLLGFAALAAWSAFVFGWPAALFTGGIECLVIAVALSDVQVRLPRLRRRGGED